MQLYSRVFTQFLQKYTHKRLFVKYIASIFGFFRFHLVQTSCLTEMEMEQGFTSHSTQNRSLWRRSSKPISWLGTERNYNKTNLENTKHRNTQYKVSLYKNTQKFKVNLYKNTQKLI